MDQTIIDRTIAPDLWHTLGGVLALRGQAFVDSVALKHAPTIAFLVVLIAGLSAAFGQSIVLFANRVRPARFVLCIILNAVLFAFGYAFLTLSTWAIMWLRGVHLPLSTLAMVLALSYAPLLFSFFEAMPYLGLFLTWALRGWSLLAAVVGVSAVAHVSIPTSFTLVILGWLVLAAITQTVGRPIAQLGARLMDMVAGVSIEEDEQEAIERVQAPQLAAAQGRTAEVAARSLNAPPDTSPRNDARGGSFKERAATDVASTKPIIVQPHPAVVKPGFAWGAVFGLLGMAVLAALVFIAFEPAHAALFGVHDRLTAWLRWPVDLAWIGLIAFIVAAIIAPLETLGWWAGWYGEELKPAPAPRTAGRGKISRYIIYLDGIAQSSDKYTPDVETFLDALAPTLPKDVQLIRGLNSYSVLNRPLDDDPILATFWTLIDTVRLARPSSVLGMLINIRNVIIVGVSADARYGPIYNYGIAKVLYDGLIANGYPPRSGIPITLIGYSGGGQMSAASAGFLKRALEAPVDMISLGGVISGTSRVLDLEHLYHLVGDKDGVEKLGPIMFWSRWKIVWASYWNRARRLGRITRISLGPVGHQVPGGMFDPIARLATGETHLEHTVSDIGKVLSGKVESAGPREPQRQSNYGLYVQAAWNRPDYYPIDRGVDSERYLPIADWIGRLILPKADERSSVRGAWFEVHHADDAHKQLVGTIVKLRWNDDPDVRRRVRAVTRDVFFSADAEYSLRHSGWIEPVRLNHWQLVEPLESLAGARPNDDMVVMLTGPVDVAEEDGATVLRVEREPAQISGRYYGLVRFVEPVGDDQYRVTHFNRASRTFDGPQEVVSVPPAVADTEKRTPSTMRSIERSPLNADGWYVYGAPDAKGTFVVQALAPRALLRARPQRVVAGRDAAWRFVRNEVWGDIAARKGTTSSTFLSGAEVADEASLWREGDRALVVYTYGGIGGQQREAAASGPVYWGHFAYGEARIVHDALADEPRFDILYHQVYSHNTDGIIAGTFHWSRFMGDRQFGWAGVRPACEIMLRHEAFTSEFKFDQTRRASVLDALVLQLEAMTARYRIGDGTGCTYVGPANNCAQDSNQALFGTLRTVREAGRFEGLEALAKDLGWRLNPFGSPRRDWSTNEFTLGSTLEDAPLQQLWLGLSSWRMLFPRYASDTVVGAFLKHGATAWVLTTDVIGGDRPEIEPIAPMTL